MCAEKLKKVSKVTVVSPTPETTATYSESKTSLTIYTLIAANTIVHQLELI
jgi:hypothetical protein